MLFSGFGDVVQRLALGGLEKPSTGRPYTAPVNNNVRQTIRVAVLSTTTTIASSVFLVIGANAGPGKIVQSPQRNAAHQKGSEEIMVQRD